MSYFSIANFYDAPRTSARAGETLTHGMVVKVLDWGNGERKLMKAGTGDAAYMSGGKYAVVTKYSTDPNQVNSSTAPSRLGSRITTISSGDHVVEIGSGAIMEYSKDLLDASLQSGAVNVGDDLTVKDGLFCDSGTSGQVSGTVVGQVFRVFGERVLIKLL